MPTTEPTTKIAARSSDTIYAEALEVARKALAEVPAAMAAAEWFSSPDLDRLAKVREPNAWEVEKALAIVQHASDAGNARSLGEPHASLHAKIGDYLGRLNELHYELLLPGIPADLT